MRKVTAGLFSSIDGLVEAPNEWQPSFDEEMGAVLSGMLEEQWCPDRDLPPDPVADQQQVRLRL